MTEPLRISCAWCHPPGSPGYDAEASHGMCAKCLAEQRERIRKRKESSSPTHGRSVLPDATDSGERDKRGPSGRVEPSPDPRTGGGASERGAS